MTTHVYRLAVPNCDPTAEEAIRRADQELERERSARFDIPNQQREGESKMSYPVLRVSSKTEVARLAQSIAKSLRENPVIAVSAVGIKACHVAQRAIGASVNLLGKEPLVRIQLIKARFVDGEKEVERDGIQFVVARDYESVKASTQ